MTDRETAFLDLVRENRARLRNICRVYAPDEAAREDLYQDILVQLWRALPSFEGKSRPGTWLYRVALNTALGQERKRDVRRRATLDPDHPLRQSAFSHPDERLETRRRRERLYEAIGRLDEIDRALVMMHLDEKSYREMADVLGISESYVGVKLHRIKKKLTEWIGEDR